LIALLSNTIQNEVVGSGRGPAAADPASVAQISSFSTCGET